MPELVSLVVYTLGRTESLRRLLASLKIQTYKNFELFVVDQNPPGYLNEVLKRGRGAAAGRASFPKRASRARNRGLAEMHGSLLAFPDDDCWYREETLAYVVQRFERDPSLYFLSGRTVDVKGQNSVSRFLTGDSAIVKHNAFIAGTSSSMFVRHALIKAIGGYNECLGVGADTPFKSGEETDLLLRCVEGGYKALFDHSLIIHRDQVNVTHARQRAYLVGYGRVLKLHNYGLPYLASRIACSTLGGTYRLARGDMQGALHRLIWLSGTMKGYFAQQAASRS
jgi:glycosyltransferase involved in cell wall biosynthesis